MSSFGGEQSDDDSVTEVPLTSSFRPPAFNLQRLMSSNALGSASSGTPVRPPSSQPPVSAARDAASSEPAGMSGTTDPGHALPGRVAASESSSTGPDTSTLMKKPAAKTSKKKTEEEEPVGTDHEPLGGKDDEDDDEDSGDGMGSHEHVPLDLRPSGESGVKKKPASNRRGAQKKPSKRSRKNEDASAENPESPASPGQIMEVHPEPNQTDDAAYEDYPFRTWPYPDRLESTPSPFAKGLYALQRCLEEHADEPCSPEPPATQLDTPSDARLQDERALADADSDGLTLQYMLDAEAAVASHIDDFVFATNTLPEGWVTRGQVERTHAAIDNCLNLLNQLMHKTGQDKEDGQAMDTRTPESAINEPIDEPARAEEVSSPGPGESDRERNEVQAMVDDIMAQPIVTENLDAKFKTMLGILNGELPWPKFIWTSKGQHEGGDFPRIECARLASRKMEEMAQSYQGALELGARGEAAMTMPKTMGRRSKGKHSNSKLNKPGSKGLKMLRRTSRASKAKAHAAQAKKATLEGARSKKPKKAKKTRGHARSSRSPSDPPAELTENDIPEVPAAPIEDENNQLHTPDALLSENAHVEVNGAGPAGADLAEADASPAEVPADPAPADAVEGEVGGPPAGDERLDGEALKRKMHSVYSNAWKKAKNDGHTGPVARDTAVAARSDWIVLNKYMDHPMAQRYLI